MDKSQKKKAAVSAVAAVTAASVLVGGAFNSPAELLEDSPDALIQTMDMELGSQTDAGDGADDGEEEESKARQGAVVRRLIMQAPVPLRALVALPLWLVGTLLCELGAVLWAAVLSPVFATLLNWLAVALVVLLVFLMAAKTIAPELPIKKILNKKSVPGILVLCLCFGVLDSVLPLFSEGYEQFSQWMRIGGSCVCTVVPLGFFLRWNKRRLRKKQESLELEEELSYEAREKAARELVLELADSVSRHY